MAKQQHLVAMVGSDTVIGTGVRVEGALTALGDITIDGTVDGSVTSEGNVTIGVNGHIRGDVQGVNLIIGGEVRGNLQASGETHLTETCKLLGDVTTQLIAIDTGANFLGTIKMQEQQRLLADDSEA